MIKPKRARIFKPYLIRHCKDAADVDMDRRSTLWGQVDYWTRTIRLYDNGIPEDVWHNLWHEMLHIIGQELKLDILENGKTTDEEKHKELDLLALAISTILIDNDWLKEK